MMGLIGRKLGMTQIPTEDGSMTAVTVIEVGPCTVLGEKTPDKDGYAALKLGFGEVSPKKLNRPQLFEILKTLLDEKEVEELKQKKGAELYRALKEKGIKLPALKISEFRVDPSELGKFQSGKEITVADVFSEGEKVDVTGTSKGRGFQGVVKRWGFSGGPKTHGSKFHRRPGSIGQHTDPGRVWKGKKMAGHMGDRRVTVKNLQVIKVYPDKHIILVKGSVPGARGSIVLVKKANPKEGKKL